MLGTLYTPHFIIIFTHFYYLIIIVFHIVFHSNSDTLDTDSFDVRVELPLYFFLNNILWLI